MRLTLAAASGAHKINKLSLNFLLNLLISSRRMAANSNSSVLLSGQTSLPSESYAATASAIVFLDPIKICCCSSFLLKVSSVLLKSESFAHYTTKLTNGTDRSR